MRPLRGSRAGAGPIVNHVGGLNELAYKSKLAVFAASLAAAHPSTFEGVAPETYILPDQLGALARRLKSEGAADAHGWPRWLSKSVKHRGVRVLPSNASEDYLRSLNAALVQRRVKPLLLRSVPRVFDLGLCVLVETPLTPPPRHALAPPREASPLAPRDYLRPARRTRVLPGTSSSLRCDPNPHPLPLPLPLP